MELGRKPLDAMRWEELWDAALLDAVRAVWASLWSDAAVLYRRELSLDPHRSRMAVLVQAVELAECSGVAFNRDPRSPDADRAVIEAVPGPCALLVDGSVDPDRWTLERTSGALIEWRPGRRGSDDGVPLLGAQDLAHLLGVLSRVESQLNRAVAIALDRLRAAGRLRSLNCQRGIGAGWGNLRRSTKKGPAKPE